MAEEGEPETELPYSCPLCRAGNSPLKNMAAAEIPRLLDDGKIESMILTDLYVCEKCGYMVFVYDREEKT